MALQPAAPGTSSVTAPAAPRNIEGALWLIASGVVFTIFLTLAKFLSSTQEPGVIAFWRAFVGFLVTVPVIFRQGRSVLVLRRPWLVMVRSFFGTVAFLFGMIAISDAFALPLSQYNAISFARSLFLTVLAALILREAVGAWRWAAVAAGFLGILVMVMPGLFLPGYENQSLVIDGGTAFALLSALGFAFTIILVKTLTATHSPMTLLIWGNLLSTVLLAPFLIFQFAAPTMGEWALLIGMALAGVAGQYCYINAMAVGDASFLAPIDYLRLPMAALADWLVFKLLPGLNVWIGAAIIVSATLVITLRERAKRAQSENETNK
ncbi:MAG: DMT family transporter [Pseudomonadota bacterium]